MERRLIIAFAAMLIIIVGIQPVTSIGRPDRAETVPAEVYFEPYTLNLNSNSNAANIYATITLEKYDVTRILEDSVVLITPNSVEIYGDLDSYILEDDIPTAVKYSFNKEDVLDGIEPVDGIVPLEVQGNIYSKWWDISFSGEGSINIKID